jgi:SAM-dependent methyltransferase
MKTEWDYTELAKAYLLRPEYAPTALDRILELAGVAAGDPVCDVGAGVAHLTLEWAARGLKVDAVEPNDAMRALGIERTADLPNVSWFEGVGEDTGRPSEAYALVSFGSSFNVCDRMKALAEAKRIGRDGAWFTAMWNHRDLQDPIQARIEDIIRSQIPDYGYGTRREDQAAFLAGSGHLKEVIAVEGNVLHRQAIEDTVEAWRSHATLHRQAGDKFGAIIDDIQAYLESLGTPTIEIPYTTRAWAGELI